MNQTILFATTARILTQLRRDRRTVNMMLVVPAMLTVLFYFTLSLQGAGADGRTPFDRLGILQLGVLPCAVMFPITAITMRRERSSGTLDRLFATPMTKLELLGGYGSAFSLIAVLQAVIVTLVAFHVTDLQTSGSALLVAMVCFLNAILGVSLGLFFSAFAQTEFQAVQFAPIVLVPQLFMAGVFTPREDMPGWLQSVSDVLPLTYSVEALKQISTHTDPTPRMWRDVAVIAAFIVAALLAGAATLRRRTP
ncbi:ABC transporter permease [Mycobacterium sp. 2YAF39]|uniref:ABC transporter permease n=1 Tax=Mycobacterium sp. 2YAF39 TaxID=3233033 RepID=UPI003F96B803